MNCSRKSTMGFAPVNECNPSSWMTSEGKNRFLQIIQEKVDNKIGQAVVINDKAELLNILEKTIIVRGDEGSVIDEVITYCVQKCVGRVNLDERLTSIRQDMIRLQPRGCYDREKGCLPMKDVKGTSNGSVYERFLKDQQKFRM